jgi:hypothetical protein
MPNWKKVITSGSEASLGTLGIGTTTPSEALEVVGDIAITDFLSISASLATALGTGGGGLTLQNVLDNGNIATQALNLNGLLKVGPVEFKTGSDDLSLGIGANVVSDTNLAADFVAVGGNSLISSTSGTANITAIGVSTLKYNAGSCNTALGTRAGFTNDPNNALEGNNNTFLGCESSYGNNNSISNATAVGANITLTNSNTVILGSGSKVGIGTTNPQYDLDVKGTARFEETALFEEPVEFQENISTRTMTGGLGDGGFQIRTGSAILFTQGFEGQTSASLGLGPAGFVFYSGSSTTTLGADTLEGVGFKFVGPGNSASISFTDQNDGDVEIKTDKFTLQNSGDITASNALFSGTAIARNFVQKSVILSGSDINSSPFNSYLSSGVLYLDGTLGGEIVNNVEFALPFSGLSLSDIVVKDETSLRNDKITISIRNRNDSIGSISFEIRLPNDSQFSQVLSPNNIYTFEVSFDNEGQKTITPIVATDLSIPVTASSDGYRIKGDVYATTFSGSFSGSFYTTPSPPTNLSLTQEDGTVVVQFTSASGDINRYEVWSSVGDENNYNLIGALNEDNFTASIQITDDTFNKNDTIYYSIYSLNHGKYSDSLTGNITVTGDVANVTDMRVMEALHGYHLEWTLPNDNRLQQVNVKVDSSTTLAGLSEANSTTFHSGLTEHTFYEVPEADANKYHQFWIDSVTRT